MAYPRRVRLQKNLRMSVLRGHPWIFDGALAPGQKLGLAEIVRVADAQGDLAVAFADPLSPIRLRVLDTTDLDARIDRDWFRERVARAARRRRVDPNLADTDAVRILHGEADGLPGLVLDLYGDHGIVLLDGAAAEALWAPWLDELGRGLAEAGYALGRFAARRVGRERDWLTEPPKEHVEVREGAARFRVDLRRGQKTGLFLDQRMNRRRVAELARARTVLNLFGYTGGFSLQAALAGASRTTTVDLAEPAIRSARDNFELSGLRASAHELVVSDVFEYLESRAESGRTFDIVICDPPSFAPSSRARPKALAAYRRVNELALAAVAPGGLFCSASCSSHVTANDLRSILAEVSHSRDLRILEERGAASDHPSRPGFPEGRYLSFFLCSAD